MIRIFLLENHGAVGSGFSMNHIQIEGKDDYDKSPNGEGINEIERILVRLKANLNPIPMINDHMNNGIDKSATAQN